MPRSRHWDVSADFTFRRPHHPPRRLFLSRLRRHASSAVHGAVSWPVTCTIAPASRVRDSAASRQWSADHPTSPAARHRPGFPEPCPRAPARVAGSERAAGAEMTRRGDIRSRRERCASGRGMGRPLLGLGDGEGSRARPEARRGEATAIEGTGDEGSGRPAPCGQAREVPGFTRDQR